VAAPTRSQNQLLREDLALARGQLDEARVQAQAQSQELGRLKAIADQSESLRTQRDQLQQQFADLTNTFQSQIGDAVKSALDQASQQHAEAAAQWAKERDELDTQIDELKKQAGAPEPVAIPPTMLASQFASVLERFAEGSGSETTAARGYAAALTTIDVEAKGLLQAPETADDEPKFVTYAPGQVDPGHLSVVRMSFRLLPHVGPTEPPPE
jgi:hypothetical protein